LNYLHSLTEAAARAKEAEEQAALPYKWTQTIGDLDITVEIPGNLKGKDLNVDIKKKKLVLGIKGQDPIISVRPHLCLSFSPTAPSTPLLPLQASWHIEFSTDTLY
jgi:hypothetical protein